MNHRVSPDHVQLGFGSVSIAAEAIADALNVTVTVMRKPPMEPIRGEDVTLQAFRSDGGILDPVGTPSGFVPGLGGSRGMASSFQFQFPAGSDLAGVEVAYAGETAEFTVAGDS
jgi:hypothetical protein